MGCLWVSNLPLQDWSCSTSLGSRSSCSAAEWISPHSGRILALPLCSWDTSLTPPPYMSSSCPSTILRCCVHPASSFTLSVISLAATGDGYCSAAVLVLMTMSLSFSQRALLLWATRALTSGALACLDNVSPMNTSL